MFQSFSDALASGDIQAIVTSTIGQIIVAVLAVGLLLLAVISAGNRKEGLSVKALTYSAIGIAIATVLSMVSFIKMPQGGTVTLFSMLFIIAIGYFFGLRTGVLAGIVYGLVQLIVGAWVVHPIQLLLDYPLAFGALGLSGLFAGQKFGLVKGVVLATLARFLCHFISGVVFFSEYAGDQNVMIYSFVYNITYIGTEGLLTAILVALPPVATAFAHVKKQALA